MLGSGGQTISIEASACTNVRLKADDGTGGLGEQIALNADEAFELVKQGRAVLAGYQERPLTEFADAAEKTLQDLDCIGPRCDAPRTLEVLQGELIDHGRTRLIIDGQKIDWYGNSTHFRSRAEGDFKVGDLPMESLLSQLRACFDRKFRGTLGTLHFSPEDERIIFRPRLDNWLDGFPPAETYRFTPDWVDFLKRVYYLPDAVQAAVSTAIGQGRILLINETQAGARLVDPERAAQLRNPWKKGEKNEAVFSRDLPRRLTKARELQGDDVRAKSKQDAKRWLKHQIKEAIAQRKRFSKKQSVEYLRENFKLTEDASKTLSREEWPEQGAGVMGSIAKADQFFFVETKA